MKNVVFWDVASCESCFYKTHMMPHLRQHSRLLVFDRSVPWRPARTWAPRWEQSTSEWGKLHTNRSEAPYSIPDITCVRFIDWKQSERESLEFNTRYHVC
jgi:hypothetical protein